MNKKLKIGDIVLILLLIYRKQIQKSFIKNILVLNLWLVNMLIIMKGY